MHCKFNSLVSLRKKILYFVTSILLFQEKREFVDQNIECEFVEKSKRGTIEIQLNNLNFY